MKPKWGEHHDKIMAEYRQEVKEGKITEIVIIPKD